MNILGHQRPLVLVVDDEEAIRDAVCDILELAEVESLKASNGLEAIELFTQHQPRVKAVLLDLRMPIMSGAETYHRLRVLDSHVPIIVSSGYDDTATGLNFDVDRAVFFLRKPYALDALLTRIQGVLG